MWFSRKNFRGLALVLLTGVATAFGVGDISPFSFTGRSADQQGEYWEDLMAFKLWGTNSLSMGHSVMLDTIGAVGSGKDAHFANNNHFIGGPIYIGGTLNDGDGETYFISGPGKINTYAAGQNESMLNGHFCINNISSHSDKVRLNGSYDLNEPRANVKRTLYFNGTLGGDCSEVLSFVPGNLEIPSISGSWPSGVIDLQGISLDNRTAYIDVPPQDKTTGKNKFDIKIPSIQTGNNSTIYVRLESSNIYARIFISGTFRISDHTNIQVVYVNKDASYDYNNHRWNNVAGNLSPVAADEYVGNLLFYTNENFELPSMDVNTRLQGTYMTPKKMKIGSNLNLTGQLLANDMEIGHDFVGDFRYMPFEKPIVKFDPVKNFKDGFPENDKWEHGFVGLDSVSKTAVSFNYCFQMGGEYTASEADFNTDGHPFPVCGKSNGTVTIPAKSLLPTAESDIWINVKKDAIAEGEEYVYLKIYNMSGAVLEGNMIEGGFKLKLIDSDLEPKSANASFIAVEDSLFVVSNTLFAYETPADNPLPQGGIVINTLPEKGYLVYMGDTLKVGGAAVKLDSLKAGKLQFISAENEYSSKTEVYTTFTFSVSNTKGQTSKNAYTMTVYVTPVNDVPTADNPTLTIDEDKSGIAVTGKIEVKDVDDSKFTYEFDDTFTTTYTKANYTKVTGKFEIDEETGVISVKAGASLNYESADSVYTIKVKITDAASTTGGTGKQSVVSDVTIKVLDVNESPVVKDTTFTINENSKPNTTVGKVTASDPDVVNPNFGTISYAIEDDVPFKIDEKGVISVASEAVLDYEVQPSYEFNVVVTDKGGKSDKATVVVNLKDLNEPPQPGDIKSSYEVEEHVIEDYVIFKVDIDDYDAADASKLTVKLTDDAAVAGKTSAADLFNATIIKREGGKAGEWTLVVTVKDSALLNYETLWDDDVKDVFYNITLTVTDAAKNSVPLSTKIVVVDVNEEPSVDDETFKISENIGIGDKVGAMKGVDPDTRNAKFGTLTYELVKLDASDVIPFDVNPSTGVITVAKGATIDYEIQDTYKFKVSVTDGEFSDEANVTVEVGDEVEVPKFHDVADASVDENTANATEITRFEVTDPDGNVSSLKTSLEDEGKVKNVTSAEDLFSASLVQDGGKWFYVISVANSAKLDYETLYGNHYNTATKKVQFNVTTVLTAKTGATSSESIVIVVNDVNEAPTATGGDFQVNEDVLVGTTVTSIKASDPDVKNTAFSSLTFVIDENSDSEAGNNVPFTINKTNGTLIVSKTLDYESLTIEDKTYKFHVTVSDGEKSVTVPVSVEVLDVAEKPKVEPGDGEVNEHAEDGHVITTVSAKDLDVGSGLTFSFKTVPADAKGMFDINSKGEIIVLSSAKLDYEVLMDAGLSVVPLIVTVKGSGGASADVEYDITVLDVNEAPTAEGFVKEIPENSPKGTKVGTVKASDPDTYNTAFSTLSFFIEENIDDNTANDVPFEVDENGLVTVVDASKLDYETKPTWTFNVKVTDGETEPQVVEVTVKLSNENEPPTLDLGANAWDVVENSATGTAVGEAKAEDVDAGDKLTYSMTSKSADALKLFEIDAASGKVTVKNKALLDYETLTEVSYTVTITVKDAKGLTASDDKVINVIDENEKPIVATTKLSVKENSIAGTFVGKVDASDPDIKNPKFGTLYYSIEDESVPFVVNGKGEISVADGAKLDYEVKSSYEFIVNVTDNEYVEPVTVIVTLEDVPERPQFPEDNFNMNVDENSKKGTSVGVVAASDDDCKDDKTCSLNYELIAHPKDADGITLFVLNASTGEITVKADNTLNYEKKAEYNVRVVVYDGKKGATGILSDTAVVTIKINDVNDAPVIANKTVTVEENAKQGVYVGTVEATDEDSWSVISYKLADSTKGSASLFEINEKTGEVYVAKGAKLDYEENKVIYVKTIAVDNGESKGFKNLSDTAVMAIELKDMPERPELVCIEGDEDCMGPFHIKENSSTGTVIHEFELRDPDHDDVGKIKLEMVDVIGTGADSLFDLKLKETSKEGVYRVQVVVKDGDKLDYEKVEEMHSIKIIGKDNSDLRDTLSRIIMVDDVNESPILEPQNFVIKEHLSGETLVGVIKNDDLDDDDQFRQNEFSVVSGDTSIFEVTSDGVIYTKRELDYEVDDHKFTLEVKLTDKNDDRVSITEKMVVNLLNVPEAPKIDGAEFSIKENVPDSTFIGKLTATDPDGEGEIDHFDLLYPNDYVYVTKDGGVYVKDSSKFDFETIDSISVAVYVIDEDGLTSDTTITIRIKDVNESPRVEDQVFDVPEDVPTFTVIGTVDASDPDVKNKDYGTLTYKLVDDDKKFKVDSLGQITVIDSLDYESKTNYNLKVVVSDGENSDTADVVINISNVVESSEVEIVRAETTDSVWVKPDTIYTNKSSIDLEWTEDGELKTGTSSLTEGTNVIVKEYKDPSKDKPGRDTVVVIVSTAEPYVTVKTYTDEVKAENFYTIVEETDTKDTAFYVNDMMNDIQVTVKDTASGVSESYIVKAKLDSVAISASEYKTVASIADAEVTLNEKPSSSVTKTPENGEKVKVSYTEKVNGSEVVVSYFTDLKGNIIKEPVMDSKGKVSNIEVITVSKEVTSGGKTVIISYKADAATGKMLVTDAEGNLMTSVPKSSGKDDEYQSKTGNGVFTVTYDYFDVDSNKVTVSYVTDEKGKMVKNEDGDTGYSLSYTYTNKFGNSATQSIFIVLDQVGPKVEILSPKENEVFHENFVDVKWTVNGEVQDTLTVQSIEKGKTPIIRIYRDKAGNESADTVVVIMKNAKNVDISVETPVTIMVLDSLQKFYEVNPPEAGETHAVSIVNPDTEEEEEVLVGGTFNGKKGNKTGSGEEPYPGLDGHIGPTLNIDLKLPTVSAIGGFATLDDLVMGKQGQIALDGVEHADSRMVSVEEYVADHCSDEFQKELGSDISKANLYNTTAYVRVWVYTSTGSFVEEYSFEQDLNDPKYAGKGGMTRLNFELKPDFNGELRNEEGRLFGTGAFVFKSEVTLKSELRCNLPPITDVGMPVSSKIGYVMKSSDDLLKKFGYKRPSTKNRVAQKSSKSSKTSKDDEEDSSSSVKSSSSVAKDKSSSSKAKSSSSVAKEESSSSKAKSSSSVAKDKSSSSKAKSSSSVTKEESSSSEAKSAEESSSSVAEEESSSSETKSAEESSSSVAKEESSSSEAKSTDESSSSVAKEESSSSES